MSTQAPRQESFKVPLRVMLSVPFVLLTVLVVSLVSYLSFRNGQRAVNDVAYRLQGEISARIEAYLVTFLNTPQLINQLNANALRQGWLPADAPTTLEHYFWKQIQVFDSVSSIYFANPSGGLVNAGREGASGDLYIIVTENFTHGTFHKYATDATGQRRELLSAVPDFDARTRPWYTSALERGTTWSDIYILFTGQDMAIAASQPVYAADETLLGVVSTDVFISQIQTFLQSLEIGETGQAFIMERSGKLVAASTAQQPFNITNGLASGERLDATASDSLLISEATIFLNQTVESYALIQQSQGGEFEIAGQRHFLLVTPLRDPYGIDWLVVVVIPESDFMAQINANNRTTALATSAALLLAITMAVLISRRITSRISQLHHAAHRLAQGQPVTTLPDASHITEISGLTKAFTTMAAQLHDLLGNLTAEIAERKRAEADLQLNYSLLQGILESSAVPIFSLDRDFRYTGFNQIHKLKMQALYGTVPQIGHDFYEYQTCEEDRVESRPNIERALRGEQFVVEALSGNRALSRRQFEITHSPVRDMQDTVIGVAIFAQDITERKQAEEALRESENRYRALFEGSPQGILVTDIETQRFHYANASICRMLGYAKANLLELSVADIHPPESLAQIQAEFITLIRGEKTITEALPLLRCDGTVFFAEIAASHLHITGRKYLVGFFADVTARIQAEAALAQERILLRTVIDNLPDAVYVKDLELRKLLINHADLENMGFEDESAALGKTDFDVFPPAVAAQFAHDDRTVLESGTPILDREERLIRPSGEERWLLTSKVPLRDTQGRMLGIIGIGHDITDRKRAEKALRASEELFREVIRTITAHIYVADIAPDGQRRHVYFSPNRSMLTGYSLEVFNEDAYFWFNHVIHPDDRPLAMEQVARLMQDEDSTADYRIIRADGEILWMRDSAHVICLADGIKRVYGFVSDVTAYKQTEAALRESETRFRHLYEQSPVAYQSLDAKGYLIEVNMAWLEELGYTREEVIGRKFTDFLVDESKHLFQERFATFKREGVVHAIEFDLRCKNDSVISATFEGRIGRSPNGKFAQTHCIFINITERKRIEKALQESRALFRSLVESIPQNIFSKDLDGHFTFANQRYCAAENKPLEELVGKTDFDLHPPDLAKQYRADDLRVIETREVIEKEEIHQTLEGTPSYVQVVKAPIYDADGQVRGMLGIFWDITERRRAEEQLRLQALVLDQIQDRVTITDLSGRITYVNQSEVDSLGHARESLIGRATDIYGEDPAQGATQQDILQRTLAEGQWRGEVINYTADKQEIILDARTRIVYDLEGQPIALCGIATDITERKQLELAQRASEERFSLAVRAGRVGIWEFWPLTNHAYYNETWYTMLGYTPYALPQDYATWRELLHPDDAVAAESHVQASLKDVLDFSMQFRMRTADNDWRWIQANGYITERDPTGTAQRVIGTHTDITEYKLIETALRGALQEREALLREIHHRVKNNLQVVCALLDLQALRADAPQINAALEESGQRIRSMAFIHEQLTHAENLAQVDMAAYVRDLVNSLRISYGLDWVEIELDVEAIALPFDSVSPCGLLINELVSNALKHAFPPEWHGHQSPGGPHGLLHIALHAPPDMRPHAVLTVADNGIGLPEERSQESPDTLGLTLVRLLSRQLDGTLEIMREGGTTFQVTFPIQG